MAVGDIYYLKLKQLYLGEEILNVFYFRETITGTALNRAAALAETWDNQILPDLALCQSEDLLYEDIETAVIRTPTVFYNHIPLTTNGVRVTVTDTAPSWMTASVRFNRNGPGTRYAYKRFSGLLVEDINENQLSGAAITLFTTNLQPMRNPISGFGFTWVPIQIKSGWTLGSIPVENFVINSLLGARLGSQNTRKP